MGRGGRKEGGVGWGAQARTWMYCAPGGPAATTQHRVSCVHRNHAGAHRTRSRCRSPRRRGANSSCDSPPLLTSTTSAPGASVKKKPSRSGRSALWTLRGVGCGGCGLWGVRLARMRACGPCVPGEADV
eukprot:358848-Chlamydomonas_euryale.AAC.15